MFETDSLLLAALILIAAILYAAVGHAGASGYLAAMALFGVAPAVMRPTALTLNILVALIATWKFYRIGAFSWRIFVPLAAGSVPFAWLGGTLTPPAGIYKALVGAVLICAALMSLKRASQPPADTLRAPPLALVLAAGAGLGLLSGLTGVGGGIFLSPLLLLMGWAEVRQVSGIAAAFILLNSIAGLAGVVRVAPALPEALPLWAMAAVCGGLVGAELGSRRIGNTAIQRLLAVVLVIAGVKMIATA